jgi:hypothetical protein
MGWQRERHCLFVIAGVLPASILAAYGRANGYPAFLS